jgi:pyruvate/2-oxoacid:ferredoxin oxidoreductase alpha subunit
MEAALGDLTQTVGAVEYNAAILEHYNKVHGTDFKPKDIRAVLR